jgi:hypothetical protein
MIPFASATTVKAVETDVKAGGIIDRVEALCAVFAVNGLVRSWRVKLRGFDVLARHFRSRNL